MGNIKCYFFLFPHHRCLQFTASKYTILRFKQQLNIELIHYMPPHLASVRRFYSSVHPIHSFHFFLVRCLHVPCPASSSPSVLHYSHIIPCSSLIRTHIYFHMLGLHGDILEIRVALSIRSRSIGTVYTSTDFEL
jgi:hypothetical protein